MKIPTSRITHYKIAIFWGFDDGIPPLLLSSPQGLRQRLVTGQHLGRFHGQGADVKRGAPAVLEIFFQEIWGVSCDEKIWKNNHDGVFIMKNPMTMDGFLQKKL